MEINFKKFVQDFTIFNLQKTTSEHWGDTIILILEHIMSQMNDENIDKNKSQSSLYFKTYF